MLDRLAEFNLISDPKRLDALFRHVWRHFQEDRCLDSAASLAYVSLLGLVPLLAIIFSTLDAFDVFSDVTLELRAFVFENFVPSFGQQVEAEIQKFIGEASGLTYVGAIALIVTSLLLMAKIEATLNRIWRVSAPRKPMNRFVIYWAVLTLGPLLIGASLGLSIYALDLPLLKQAGTDLGSSKVIIRVGIFLLTWGAFTSMFLLIPNRKVFWRDAATGALVSTVLFEIAKWVFGNYVTQSSAYATLYGALAVIPLFLVWIYVSWVVILLGASLSASLTTFVYERADWRWPRKFEFQLLFRVLGHLWVAQKDGRIPTDEDLLARETAASDSQIQRQLQCLYDAGWIQRDENENWILVRDLAECSLEEFISHCRLSLPWLQLEDMPEEHEWDRQLKSALLALKDSAGDEFSLPIKQFYKSAPPPQPVAAPANRQPEDAPA